MKSITSKSAEFYLLFVMGFVFLFSSCTKDKGTISMTYNKGTAVYGDLEQIRSTPLIAAPRSVEDPGKIFIGESFLLIGEENEGIHVYDNSNPNNPVNVSFIQLPFTKEFYVENNTIYAESHYDFLKIDLNNINSPVLVSRVENAFGDPITNDAGEVLIGFDYKVTTESFKLNSPEARTLEDSYYLYYDYLNQLIPPSSVPSSFAGNSTQIKGTLNKIAIYDKHIYIIGDDNIYYFEDGPTNMFYLNKVRLQNGLETIYSENNHLFIGTERSMVVVDVSSPSSPMVISEYWHPTSCDPVYPFGNVAYLTLRTDDFAGCNGNLNSLDVINISNINNPMPMYSIPMNSPYGMSMINNHLFVGEGINGLTVFNAADPTNLIHISNNEDIEAYDIMMHPTIPNRILTTSENGLEQYSIDFNTMNISFISRVNY